MIALLITLLIALLIVLLIALLIALPNQVEGVGASSFKLLAHERDGPRLALLLSPREVRPRPPASRVVTLPGCLP